MKILSLSERQHLELQLKRTRDFSEGKRLCAILGYADGSTIDELATVLRISPFTVEAYLKDYNSNQKTKNDPRGGQNFKLTEKQSQELEKHLQERTYLKVKHIIAYVEVQYGVKYSRSGMTLWLNQHNFAYKCPKKVPGKLDPEKQKAFVEEYERLKRHLNSEDEIYFVDAVHPEHQSQAVCGWIRKGIQKTLQTTGKQRRLHFAGALCLKGMKIVTNEYETVDADAMLDFFRKLENRSKAPTIHVILDNARANKNKKLEAFLITSRIKVHYLPPYSPNLNSIERLWKVMRETKIYNRYYESSMIFFKEIRNFFAEEVPKIIKSLTHRINDNFQIIQLNPISFG
jgi:transposase